MRQLALRVALTTGLPNAHVMALYQCHTLCRLASGQGIGQDSTLEFFLNDLAFAIHQPLPQGLVVTRNPRAAQRYRTGIGLVPEPLTHLETAGLRTALSEIPTIVPNPRQNVAGQFNE
jgi:hypothetical protein